MCSKFPFNLFHKLSKKTPLNFFHKFSKKFAFNFFHNFFFNYVTVHLPGQGQKPENQTIFIHQQQTPRGSIQVVHHQVKVGSGSVPQPFPMFTQNQPTNIPMPRGGKNLKNFQSVDPRY